MIRLGLRLAVAGGREAITRLALIAAAVAIGSGLLLTTLASTNAFRAQNERYAWLETGYPGAEPAAGRRRRWTLQRRTRCGGSSQADSSMAR